MHSISKKYGIDRKSIRDLVNQEELKVQINYKKYKLSWGGCKSQISKENETKIVNWIIQTPKDLLVTTTVVMNYIIKLEPDLKDKSNKAISCLKYRFLQKFNFVLRKASHIGQPLPLFY